MPLKPQEIERFYPKGRFPSPKHKAGYTLWAREHHIITESGDFVGYVADYPSEARIDGKIRNASVMPKEFSRIDLKVKDIVSERLWKEINREHSFEAEGFIETKHACDGCVLCDPVLWVSSWWDSKYPNAEWNSNPYVFVYKLDVVLKGE